MKSRSLLVILGVVALSTGCEKDTPIEAQISPDQEDGDLRAEKFDFQGTESELLRSLMRKKGRWRYSNGRRLCDGYLTPSIDQDYCESDAPEDWQSFSFDGRTYYFQPLSGPMQDSDSIVAIRNQVGPSPQH